MKKVSKEAVLVEHRIEQEMKELHQNLAPPYKKPKREGKLTRSVIKKKTIKIPKKITRISNRTLFFYNAFHEEEPVTQLEMARASLNIMETIQESIVPFYFDHFLILNGYVPNYNFRTQVDARDGPEINRLKKRSIIPEVMSQLEKWEQIREKIKEDHINKHPEMYQNVKF